MFFIAILTAESCDQFYEGCTQNYKDILGKKKNTEGNKKKQLGFNFIQETAILLGNLMEQPRSILATIFSRPGSWRPGTVSA